LWGNLESYVQQQAKSNTGNISVFNGPVFRISDRPYRDVLLPKEFWKVILYADSEGKPRAAAFILSQESLVKDLPLEEMVWTPYQPFQVKVATLEQRTHLDFGELVDADVLATPGHESFLEATTGSAMPINRLQDILL
jgi:endonuclease G